MLTCAVDNQPGVGLSPLTIALKPYHLSLFCEFNNYDDFVFDLVISTYLCSQIDGFGPFGIFVCFCYLEALWFFLHSF